MSNLAMTRGDHAVFRLAVTDAAGDPFDLTDIPLRFTAKRTVTDADADAVFAKTTDTDDGITIVGSASDGIAEIGVEPADTDAMTKTAVLVWDIQLVDDDDPYTLDSGYLTVTADVSVTVP